MGNRSCSLRNMLGCGKHDCLCVVEISFKKKFWRTQREFYTYYINGKTAATGGSTGCNLSGITGKGWLGMVGFFSVSDGLFHRTENRLTPLFLDPPIHHIRPLLQHIPALLRVFCFVVDCADAALLMRQTLLYPVSIKPRLMQ